MGNYFVLDLVLFPNVFLTSSVVLPVRKEKAPQNSVCSFLHRLFFWVPKKPTTDFSNSGLKIPYDRYGPDNSIGGSWRILTFLAPKQNF